MQYQQIALDKFDSVAVLSICRPTVLNALNEQTLREIGAAVEDVERDASTRALVVVGAGDKAFVAGGDIREIRDLESADAAALWCRRAQTILHKIERLRIPVVMAINGYALGGGTELALAGDIRIASEEATFGLPEINLGIIPGFGGTQRLPRLVGKGMAKLMVFTGARIDAAEALRIGLVDKVVPAEDLMTEARALAAQLASKAAVALALAKRSINEGMETDLDRGCALEATLFGIACSTQDRLEGTQAFLEKRQPVFTGK